MTLLIFQGLLMELLCIKIQTMNIHENMGNADRIIRTLLAVIFAAAYFNGFTSGIVGIISLVMAWAFLATSVFGNCPLYSLLGIGTKMKHHIHH